VAASCPDISAACCGEEAPFGYGALSTGITALSFVVVKLDAVIN
jgi:hypothetical protein